MTRRHCPGCCGDCPVCSHVLFTSCPASLPTTLEQISGTWSIGSEEPGPICFLKEAGAADAIILCEEKAEMIYQKISATLSAAGQVSGAVPRLIINYKDASNYYYADFEENAFEIFKAPSTSLIRSTAAGWSNSNEIFLCFNGANQLIAGVEADIAMACASPIKGGYQGGVGNGASAEIRIEQFTLTNGEDHPEDCASCCCHRCDNTCVPKILLVTIVSDECTAYPNGETFLIENTWDCSASGGDWTTVTGCWDPVTPPDCPVEFAFHLSCGWVRGEGDRNCENWTLEWDNAGAAGGDCSLGAGGTTMFSGSNCTCDPFFLSFTTPVDWGPEEETSGCCSSSRGFLTFEITEP